VTGDERRSTLAESRRRLIVDSVGISVSASAFGLVYGLAARNAGFSVVEALASSVLVLAGASQFAAIGLVAQGVPWLAIILLTGLLNARHLLYSAALAPWLSSRPRTERAAMAHVLTDETFALSLAHFRRIGRADHIGFWITPLFVCVPWIVATAIGVIGGAAIPDPATLGLDVVFPAAMAGLAVGVVRGRRELVAAVFGASVAVVVGLASDAAVGIVTGGLLGPIAGMLTGGPATAAEATSPDMPRPAAEGVPR
jgi:4-azaleucine resistance transporter AzlC